MMTKAPIVGNYKQDLRTIMESNFSKNLSCGILFQLDKARLLHLIAFFSENPNPA